MHTISDCGTKVTQEKTSLTTSENHGYTSDGSKPICPVLGIVI